LVEVTVVVVVTVVVPATTVFTSVPIVAWVPNDTLSGGTLITGRATDVDVVVWEDGIIRFTVVTVVVATLVTDFGSTVSRCPLAVITETKTIISTCHYIMKNKHATIFKITSFSGPHIKLL
jgi:hypothetical protein